MSSSATPSPEVEHDAATPANPALNAPQPRANPPTHAMPPSTEEPGSKPSHPVPGSIQSLSRRVSMGDHSNLGPLNPPLAKSVNTAPSADGGPGAAMPRKRSIVIVDTRRPSASTTASASLSNQGETISSSNTPNPVSSDNPSGHLQDPLCRRTSVALNPASPEVVKEELEGELSASRGLQVATVQSETAFGVLADRLPSNIQSTASLMVDGRSIPLTERKGVHSESEIPADSQGALASHDRPMSASALASKPNHDLSTSSSGGAIQTGRPSTASNASGASKPNIASLLTMSKRHAAGLPDSTLNGQHSSQTEAVPKTPASLTDDSYNPFGGPSPSNPLLQRTESFRRVVSSASKALRGHRAETDASATTSTLDPSSPTGQQSYLTMAKKSEHFKEEDGKGAAKGPGGKARRMSLGAALMMPPPPRTANAMDLKTIIKFTISAVGILYGDVAAAPMFVFKSVFREGLNQKDPAIDIYGALSMMFYTTLFLGIFKYCLVVLHADNNGEGVCHARHFHARRLGGLLGR